MRRRTAWLPWLMGALLAASTAVVAAPRLQVITTDLEPAIRAAAPSRTQFAVPVAHRVSTATAGRWSVAGNRATWRYTVRVPGAVSMSFHASSVSLPAGATLSVRGVASAATYHDSDLHKGELWSRIQPGNTLELTLSVAVRDRAQTKLEITSLQAGYRSLGAGVEDSPVYRRALAQANTTANASCVQNFACSVSAANTPAAQATVAVVVNNQYQCSGVLLNDVPGDNTPYVLTSRQCQTGALGGGNPGAASTVTVYWDASSACGSTLGSIYDQGVRTQSGASTIVEQQDAWLIKLDYSPVVSDAQFAGFDASGGVVQGGYTVHHALGFDKQLITWSGIAAAVQQSGAYGTQYLSNFWETVNATGNIGAGASGSGLFDQNNHLVGALALTRQTADSSGYEACPLTPPPAPNGSNGVADFTSLAAIWNSTADTTSTTHGKTLASVLDPGGTGTTVVSGSQATNVAFTASTYNQAASQAVTLTWNAPGAASCTAGGGAAGDGWTGTLAASGSQDVTETFGSTTGYPIGYSISCALGGGTTVSNFLDVNWFGLRYYVHVTVPGVVWAGAAAELNWTSNESPCELSWGTVDQPGLPSSGSVTITSPTVGEVAYWVFCGTGGPPAVLVGGEFPVSYVAPSVTLTPNSPDRLQGEPLAFTWSSVASSCVPLGGAPGDGWSEAAFATPSASFTVVPPPPGTYTYTLLCYSPPLSAQASTTVTVENNAPYVTTSVDTATVTLSDTPADYITMTWQSNLSICSVNTSPALPSVNSNPSSGSAGPTGTVVFAPNAVGTYTVGVSCFSKVNGAISAASTPIVLTVLPPPPPTASITAAPLGTADFISGIAFELTWSSTNAATCSGTFSGAARLESGWVQQLESTSGGIESGATINYGLTSTPLTVGVTCTSIDSNQAPVSAQTTFTLLAQPNYPSISFSLIPTTVTQGQTFEVKWSTTQANSCVATGGGADGQWTGSMALSGDETVAANTSGTFSYSLTCTGGDGSREVGGVETVNPPTTSGGGGGGGGGGGRGGGGALGLLTLGALALACGSRLRRSRLSSVEQAQGS